MSGCHVRRLQLLQEVQGSRERVRHFEATYGSQHAMVAWAKAQLELAQSELLALADCGE